MYQATQAGVLQAPRAISPGLATDIPERALVISIHPISLALTPSSCPRSRLHSNFTGPEHFSIKEYFLPLKINK
jgi:hypothetical protein